MAQPAPQAPASLGLPADRMVRVMLVDDSLVVRSILERIVDQRSGLMVCASVASAQTICRLEPPVKSMLSFSSGGTFSE